MIKILFLIHDLGSGGAEKVLVNLVNNMDRSKFDISVTALFGGGVNEQFLKSDIKFRTVFPRKIPGNSKLMKIFTPEILHKMCVDGAYDIEVSYLEGPSARIISGCKRKTTKLVSWIHCEHHDMEQLSMPFRSDAEARTCYGRFDQTICVSQFVRDNFCNILNYKKPCCVLYNTVESLEILRNAQEAVDDIADDGCVRIIGVGTLKESKGFERLLKITRELLKQEYKVHLYILGTGELQDALSSYIKLNQLDGNISLLGYHTNPYKYVAKADLFVCSSYSEGFSTAASEALILGIPVCTVDVSGMKEMLGENNEYGVVVDNNDEALYGGIKRFLDEPELLMHYRNQARIRGSMFSTENTVAAVEKMLVNLLN